MQNTTFQPAATTLAAIDAMTSEEKTTISNYVTNIGLPSITFELVAQAFTTNYVAKRNTKTVVATVEKSLSNRLRALSYFSEVRKALYTELCIKLNDEQKQSPIFKALATAKGVKEVNAKELLLLGDEADKIRGRWSLNAVCALIRRATGAANPRSEKTTAWAIVNRFRSLITSATNDQRRAIEAIKKLNVGSGKVPSATATAQAVFFAAISNNSTSILETYQTANSDEVTGALATVCGSEYANEKDLETIALVSSRLNVEVTSPKLRVS